MLWILYHQLLHDHLGARLIRNPCSLPHNQIQTLCLHERVIWQLLLSHNLYHCDAWRHHTTSLFGWKLSKLNDFAGSTRAGNGNSRMQKYQK